MHILKCSFLSSCLCAHKFCYMRIKAIYARIKTIYACINTIYAHIKQFMNLCVHKKTFMRT